MSLIHTVRLYWGKILSQNPYIALPTSCEQWLCLYLWLLALPNVYSLVGSPYSHWDNPSPPSPALAVSCWKAPTWEKKMNHSSLTCHIDVKQSSRRTQLPESQEDGIPRRCNPKKKHCCAEFVSQVSVYSRTVAKTLTQLLSCMTKMGIFKYTLVKIKIDLL